MKRLSPTATSGLERTAPFAWRSGNDDPGFVFDVSNRGTGFIGFFLMASDGGSAPQIAFDEGTGFSDIKALNLKAFPFAFYHVSLDKLRHVERLRFRPRNGTGPFRFLAFRTSNAILVAVLHYLFNLRYQNIGIVVPDAKGRARRWTTFKATTARIIKFFRDVSKGGGVRVQEGAEDMLPVLKMAMSLKAADVRDRLADELGAPAAPLISFVAPTWNTRRNYLDDLLTSYADQNAPYAELVLSDDGSTNPDVLAALREAATRSGIKAVFNPTNRGIAAATNAGIAAARGRWIAFIDHDDVFVSGAIAVIADAILRHPDAIFFYTDEIIVDDVLKPTGCFCKPAYDSGDAVGRELPQSFLGFSRGSPGSARQPPRGPRGLAGLRPVAPLPRRREARHGRTRALPGLPVAARRTQLLRRQLRSLDRQRPPRPQRGVWVARDGDRPGAAARPAQGAARHASPADGVGRHPQSRQPRAHRPGGPRPDAGNVRFPARDHHRR